jgi:hypothetical protein
MYTHRISNQREMDMRMTEQQKARVTEEYTTIAGEPVTVEQIGSTIYLFGSELATLRCFKVCHECNEVHQGLSDDMNSYYISWSLNLNR